MSLGADAVDRRGASTGTRAGTQAGLYDSARGGDHYGINGLLAAGVYGQTALDVEAALSGV